MSRIGRQPIVIPSGVKASINSGTVFVEGPLGKMQYKPAAGVSVAQESGRILVSISATDKQSRENYGTTRARIANLVKGVSKGFKRSLELVGTGYTAKLEGQKLALAVGLSHDVQFELPKAIKCTIGKNANNIVIDLESNDCELLGTFAAKVRKSQPPEPYLGKGIKYTDEVIRRKAGKAGKK